MTTDAAGPLVPQEIASKYALGAVRLQSATATLYEARDPDSGAPAVIKVLRAEAIPSVPERQRVRRELTKLTTLRHDSLASVLASPDGGVGGDSLWLVRAWIDGETLRERVKRTGPIAPGEAAHIASRIAGALGELHRQGVLHRDLRAGHVILAPDDKVFLLDPSVGRMFKSPEGRPIVGTPGSVAPEAISGKLVSFRSDLYGLGIVLYEMLTGVPPFDPDDPEVLRKQSDSDPAPLPDTVPAAFSRLVTSLLSRDARERPFSAQQLERQLEPLVDLADPRRSLAPPVPATPATTSVTTPSLASASAPPPVPAVARMSAPPPVPGAAKRPSAPETPPAPTPIDADFDLDEDSARTLMGAPVVAPPQAPPSPPVAPMQVAPMASPSLPNGIPVPGAQDFDFADEAPTKVSSVAELQHSLNAALNGSVNGAVNGAAPTNGVAQPTAPAVAAPDPQTAALRLPRMPTIPPIPAGAPRISAPPVQPNAPQNKATLMGLAQITPEMLPGGAQPPAGAVVVPPRRQDLDYDDVAETSVNEESRVFGAPPDAPGSTGNNIAAPAPGPRPNSTLLGVVAPNVQPPYGPQGPVNGAFPQQVNGAYGQPPQPPNPAFAATAAMPNASWAPQPPAPNGWQAPQQPPPQGFPQTQAQPQQGFAPQGFQQPQQPQGFPQTQQGAPQAQGFAQASSPSQVPVETPRTGVPVAVWVVAALALIMIPGVGGFAVARYRSQHSADQNLPTLTVVPPTAAPSNGTTPEAAPNVAQADPNLVIPPILIPSSNDEPAAPARVDPPILAQPTHEDPPILVPPTHEDPPVRVARNDPPPHAAHNDPPAHAAHNDPPAVRTPPATNNHAPQNTPPVATNTHPPAAPPAVAAASTGDLNEAIRRRDWAGAARILETQVRAQPTSAPLHSQLASMYERAGQPQRALSEYRTALRYDRRNVGTMHRLADTQLSTGDRAGAIATFRQILAIAPGDPAATARLASLQGGGR